MTPSGSQEPARGAALAEEVQAVTGNTVEVAYVVQGYTRGAPAEASAEHGIDLVVLSLPEATRGLVLLPRRWVVERSFAWATWYRRLAKGYERLPDTVVGMQLVAVTCLAPHRARLGLAPSLEDALVARIRIRRSR